MKLEGKKVGFAMCGSFCTFSRCFETLEQLAGLGCELIPIMSFNAYSINTRFGEAKEHIKRLEKICGREVIHTIEGAEPIGPKKMADIMLVANCTGNTLAKLALSITDTPVNTIIPPKIVYCYIPINTKENSFLMLFSCFCIIFNYNKVAVFVSCKQIISEQIFYSCSDLCFGCTDSLCNL